MNFCVLHELHLCLMTPCIILIGNDYSTDVSLGRQDAHDGLIGFGHGDGNFDFVNAHESGFFVQEDGKALVSLYHQQSQSMMLIASQNKGPLKAYSAGEGQAIIEVNEADQYAIITDTGGKQFKKEFYHGSGFISQSTRSMIMNNQIESVQIFDAQGNERRISSSDL